MSQQPDIETIFLYAKDLYEEKYPFLSNQQVSTRLKHLNDSKPFV